MKNTQRVYLLSLKRSSKKDVRLWTGKHIHALRYCTAKQVGTALREMRQHVDELQQTVALLTESGSYSLNRVR